MAKGIKVNDWVYKYIMANKGGDSCSGYLAKLINIEKGLIDGDYVTKEATTKELNKIKLSIQEFIKEEEIDRKLNKVYSSIQYQMNKDK